MQIVFWQQIVSIHQAPLIVALAAIPGFSVTYVAQKMVSESRRKLGWTAPPLGNAELVLVDSAQAIDDLLPRFSAQAIHICQGFRGNGLVGVAERLLRKREARIVVIAETIDDDGLIGVIKRLVYGRILRRAEPWTDAILAIGARTPQWFADRGFPASRIFPFTYFLEPPALDRTCSTVRQNNAFQIAFIGNLIHWKRLDLLIEALGRLALELDFRLTVIGGGPLEDQLRRMAENRLGDRVTWCGLLPSSEIPGFLAGVDCLVLPSRHDGWGAVVTEALLVGTPAVCSDACGASEAVRHSGVGGVFPSGDVDALADCLRKLIAQGPITSDRRARLAAWAQSLSGPVGARYLVDILRHRFENAGPPVPPWISMKD